MIQNFRNIIKTGAERIELPLRVLETPVMPFDQAPMYFVPYIYTTDFRVLSILYILFEKFY